VKRPETAIAVSSDRDDAPYNLVRLAAFQRILVSRQPMLFDARQQAEFKNLIRWAIDVDSMAI
jgi:hypothetical protein